MQDEPTNQPVNQPTDVGGGTPPPTQPTQPITPPPAVPTAEEGNQPPQQ